MHNVRINKKILFFVEKPYHFINILKYALRGSLNISCLWINHQSSDMNIIVTLIIIVKIMYETKQSDNYVTLRVFCSVLACIFSCVIWVTFHASDLVLCCVINIWLESSNSKCVTSSSFINILKHVFSRRSRDEYSPYVLKRQRLESSSRPLISSPPIQTPPLLHVPDQEVAGSSRSAFTRNDRSYHSPHSYLHPQVSVIPEDPNSLQVYAKDKVYWGSLNP